MTERVGAIVLAGGRSSRFGRDKLAEPLDGWPLLHHAIEAVQEVATDVVVVVAPDAERQLPPGVLVAHDERAFEGPLAGLAVGLAALDPQVEGVIVVGGDMPDMIPTVLRRLVDWLWSTDSAAVVLGVEGKVGPLPMALRAEAARSTANDLLAGGERRLRALPRALVSVVIPAAIWRLDDPTAATLHDIDTLADLRHDR